MLSLLAEVLGEIVLFIARLLAESFFALLLNWLLRALVGVGRTVVLLAFWPLMLLMGWLRLWQRERTGPLVLWRAHGPRGLHRFGWQEAARYHLRAGSFTARNKVLATSRALFTGCSVVTAGWGRYWLGGLFWEPTNVLARSLN